MALVSYSLQYQVCATPLHIRGQNAQTAKPSQQSKAGQGRPARPGQPEHPDSQAKPARQGRPGQPARPPRQPSQANRRLEFVEHDFAGQKSTRRWCQRSGQKPAREQYRRLDFCSSLGIALAKSYPTNSKRPMRQRAHRDVSISGAVLHLALALYCCFGETHPALYCCIGEPKQSPAHDDP